MNGSGYASDIFRDLVSAFGVLQRGNVTVISRKCLMEPSEPKPSTAVLLGTHAKVHHCTLMGTTSHPVPIKVPTYTSIVCIFISAVNHY